MTTQYAPAAVKSQGMVSIRAMSGIGWTRIRSNNELSVTAINSADTYELSCAIPNVKAKYDGDTSTLNWVCSPETIVAGSTYTIDDVTIKFDKDSYNNYSTLFSMIAPGSNWSMIIRQGKASNPTVSTDYVAGDIFTVIELTTLAMNPVDLSGDADCYQAFTLTLRCSAFWPTVRGV